MIKAIILSAIAVIATVALAVADSHRVASNGDRYRVTAHRVRSEIAKTGLKVRYVRPQGESVRAVVGVALSSPADPIGFEYQLYQSSDEANVNELGKLKAPAFGWPKPRLGVVFEPIVRGVLGNVAFAIYERRFLEKEGSREEALKSQLAAQRILRWLDNALFNSFPTLDPYANARLRSP